MTGVIDVGGGMRAIYGTGVFDYCLDNNITFDYCAGVSAGSANLASFLAGQRGRNYIFYTQYAFRREYMSMRNFVHRGSYINLDYVYGTLSVSGGENPLDYNAIAHSKCEFLVVATDARTGEPVYFDKNNLKQDNYDILKASSCVPVACKPYFIEGIPCYDGGISDPIPLDKLIDAGCDKIVLILTKPVDMLREAKKDALPAKLLRRKYPNAAEKLRTRFNTYNTAVARARQLEKQGKVLIIAPDDCCGLDTLKKDVSNLDKMYHKGYNDAQKINEFLK